MGRGGGHSGGGGHSHSRSYRSHSRSYSHSSYHHGSYTSLHDYFDCFGECSRTKCTVVAVVCFVILTGLILGLISVFVLSPFKYCSHSSTDLFDGEQNLCSVPETKDTVYVHVNPLKRNKFTSYLLDKEPGLLLDQVRYVKYNDSYVRVYCGDYTYYAFALPKGSNISFYVFSDDSYSQWYFSEEYGSIYRLVHDPCFWKKSGSGSFSFNMTVNKSMTYYLTFYNSCSYGHRYANTNWDIDVYYRQYNVSNATKTCSGKSICRFKKAGGKYVVSSLKNGTLGDGDYTMNAINYGRDYNAMLPEFILISLGMVPIILLIILSLVMCHSYSSTGNKSPAKDETNQELLSSSTTETPVGTPSSEPSFDTPN